MNSISVNVLFIGDSWVDLSGYLCTWMFVRQTKKFLKCTEHRSPRSMRCGTENKVAPRLTCEFALFCFSTTSEKAKPPSNVRKNE